MLCILNWRAHSNISWIGESARSMWNLWKRPAKKRCTSKWANQTRQEETILLKSSGMFANRVNVFGTHIKAFQNRKWLQVKKKSNKWTSSPSTLRPTWSTMWPHSRRSCIEVIESSLLPKYRFDFRKTHWVKQIKALATTIGTPNEISHHA